LFEKQKRKREEKYITKWRTQAPGEAAMESLKIEFQAPEKEREEKRSRSGT
jgi:hypothetical protein